MLPEDEEGPSRRPVLSLSRQSGLQNAQSNFQDTQIGVQDAKSGRQDAQSRLPTSQQQKNWNLIW